MLELKGYQKNALNVLESYLTECRRSGDPEKAFRDSLVSQNVVTAGKAGAIRYVKPAGLENIPYVCIRIPTGGGKTILASHAVERIRSAFLETDFPLVLWLVPSNAIREQTMACLTVAGHPYRQALEEKFGENIRVFDIGALESLSPQDMGSKAIIVVGTLQTLRVNDEAGRRIYAHSEVWERHFARLTSSHGLDFDTDGPRKGRIRHSFVNLCRVYRPWIIMDEAHNARTSLTFDTLARLAPSGILEMTATPDSKPGSGSNVLFATSATELKLENMIKLPIHLTEHEGWRETVDAAIQERRRLEEIARGEERYLRPIVLFQAENKDREVTQDVLRDYLMKVDGITEDEIAVATGSVRDLDGVNLFARSCAIKYIITVQALKEGWDCSFAYVFCSVANIGSQKDVEQLLGRVLRLPDATPYARTELNRAYAHVSSHSFSDAAAALKDKMVSKMGFEKIEADLYVDPNASLLVDPDPDTAFVTDGIAADYRSMRVVMDEEPDFSLLGDETAAKLTIERRDNRVIVSIHGAIDENESRLFSEKLATGPRAAEIGKLIRTYRAIAVNTSRGPGIVHFAVPELHFEDPDSGADIRLESGHFASLGGFSLARGELCSPVLTEANFSPRAAVHESSIDVVNGKVTYDSFGSAESSQFWLYDAGEVSWETARLVSWLDAELKTADILQHELQAFLFRVIRHLTDVRNISLAELAAFKYRFLEALRTRLSEARKAASKTGFNLFSGSEIPHRKMNWSWDFSFDLNRPPYTKPQDLVAGGYRFAKHFFPMIQDIKDRGEELECAKIIDGRIPQIATWVRNIPRRPESFHLPTSRGEFYPDFVCLLTDDRVLVAEYKGDHLKDDLDEGEKKLIGEAWARGSGGKALFAWIRKRDEAGRDVYGQLVDCVHPR